MAKKNRSRHGVDAGIEEFTNKGFNWFPGHMMKAVRKIKEHLKSVDIVVEIRDARAPVATSNKLFVEQIGNKSHLIVVNKANLSDPKINEKWEKWFSTQEVPAVFVNGLDRKSLNKVLKAAKTIVREKHQQSNPGTEPKGKLRMMIIGLPNTGKSTIINRFANRDASKVADKPGQTQQQLWVNASEDLEILDTPGIMPPAIKNEEEALWLSALHAIPERIADYEDTACYIVRHIIKTNPEVLVSHYKIKETSQDLIETLNSIATARGCILKGNTYDYNRVYKMTINDFRDGYLGLINFEFPPE